MDDETRGEFERLEGRITWAAKVAIMVSLSIAMPVAGGALVVYAQTNDAVHTNERQDKDLEKLHATRDKVLQLEPRLGAIEKSVDEVKKEQLQQRSILEDIRREVKK